MIQDPALSRVGATDDHCVEPVEPSQMENDFVETVNEAPPLS